MHTDDVPPNTTLPYRPTTQAVHTAEVVEPARFAYIPAPHAVHAKDVPADATVPYLPTTQAVHTSDELVAARLP